MSGILLLLQRCAVALQSLIDRPDVPDDIKPDLEELGEDIAQQIEQLDD